MTKINRNAVLESMQNTVMDETQAQHMNDAIHDLQDIDIQDCISIDDDTVDIKVYKGNKKP